MPTTHISGPYLREYPTIIRELKRLHISLHDVRCVEIITGEIVFRDSQREPFGSMQFNPQATVILHSGESVELTYVTLEKCIPTLHTGYLGGSRSVRHKKRVWDEILEKDVPGIRLKSRNLTADQALELLEWLEQERPALEQKAQEEAKLG